jgi:hypothetical protein
VFDFLLDQNFLSALATVIGPLAFFAAPTEEIERLLMGEVDNEVSGEETIPDTAAEVMGIAKAA